jgi:hypothetical protein
MRGSLVSGALDRGGVRAPQSQVEERSGVGRFIRSVAHRLADGDLFLDVGANSGTPGWDARLTRCRARQSSRLETAWEGPAHQQLVAFGFTPERLESVGPLDNISYTNTRQQ